MPRDIVGGDFIFTNWSEQGYVIAVIDCTGHGVPGAFMTIIACFGLRKIIRDEGWHDPSRILRRLSFLVKTALHQDTDYALSDDGLDAAISFVNFDEATLTFAGAKLPLIYAYNNEIITIKGDRKSVGYKRSDINFEYANHTINIRKGMSFYMFSDGFTDQLGEKNDRRFGTRRLKNLLREISDKPFEKQEEILIRSFEHYKGKNERQDDVTMVGFGFR